MLSIGVIISILFLHLLGDFILQSDWMAINKSRDTNALVAHTVVYSLCFIPFGFVFYLITWATHTATDAITSRITSRLWQRGKRHWFFVVIGVDQFIHHTTLFVTYLLLN
jgi:hypothetical protein